MAVISSRSVHVSNLPVYPLAEMEELLFELFLQVGPVSKVYLPYDKETGNHKGFAFIEFLHEESVLYSCKAMHGIKLLGFYIGVKAAMFKTMEQQPSVGEDITPDHQPQEVPYSLPPAPPPPPLVMPPRFFTPPFPPPPSFPASMQQQQQPQLSNFSFQHPFTLSSPPFVATSITNVIAPPNHPGLAPPNHQGLAPSNSYNMVPPPPPPVNFNMGSPNNSFIVSHPNPNMIPTPMNMLPPTNGVPCPDPNPLSLQFINHSPSSVPQFKLPAQSCNNIEHQRPTTAESTPPLESTTNGNQEAVNPFKEAALILSNIRDAPPTCDPVIIPEETRIINVSEDSNSSNSSTMCRSSQLIGKLLDYYKHREQLK